MSAAIAFKMFIKEIFIENVIRAYEADPPTINYTKLDLFNPVFYPGHDAPRGTEAYEAPRKVA